MAACSSSENPAQDAPDDVAETGVSEITEQELMDALGSPPPDLAAEAETLGITEAALTDAMGISAEDMMPSNTP